MKRLIIYLGLKVNAFFLQIGDITLFTGQIFGRIFRGSIHTRNTLEQATLLGINSLPIVLVTALFVGMAFAVQLVKEFLKFGAAKMIGGVLALALWRELAPMLIGVVIAGRIGAAISAELGTMKVTEQIEAIESMGQDPIHYLVVPRVIAVTCLMPLLVGMADIVGFLGGFMVAVASGRVNPYAYFASAQDMLVVGDVLGGLIKALFFGLMTAVIATYMGLHATAGAKGVGEVTIRAVVASLIAVFVLNYFLSMALFLG